MPVDKFGRFYTGSLDKFGRYHPYGIDHAKEPVKKDEIVGAPLESPKHVPEKHYSETTIALYGTTDRYSEYKTYEGDGGVIVGFSVDDKYSVLLNDKLIVENITWNIKKGDTIRLYKKVKSNNKKATFTLLINRSPSKTETSFVGTVNFNNNCRVFRFLQDSGVVVKANLSNISFIYLNGKWLSRKLEGQELVSRDVITFIADSKDTECELFFVIRSPVHIEA